jgi:3-dehydroquinate synthase
VLGKIDVTSDNCRIRIRGGDSGVGRSVAYPWATGEFFLTTNLVTGERLLETVHVELSERSYPIFIGSALSPRLIQWIGERLPKCRHAVVIADAQVKAFATGYTSQLADAGMRLTHLTIPSGESSKSIEQATRLWEAMLDGRTDRGSVVIAIGGGVVGDLAGFVAATFARGLPLIQIPTTLLSHVDSSVGGKTGVNLPHAKNMVGAFWQPHSVWVDLLSLTTLPQREFISGLAEVVKYGVILLPDLLDFMERQTSEILCQEVTAISHLVAHSCRAKAQVVQQDERETTGLRAILNYGHTFAHALESVLGYGQLLHGEAVSIGMHMAACLAELLGRVDRQFVQRQHALLTALQLPTRNPQAAVSELWAAMQHDKKVEHGTLRFILPSRFGHVELVAGISQAQVFEAIKRSQSDLEKA